MNRSIKLFLSLAIVVIAAVATQNSQHFNNDDKLSRIKVRNGFKIEHLLSPSDAGFGSWVSMAFDPKGRLITSDQYGSLYRLTLPKIGEEVKNPKIEKLTISGDPLGMGTAQGLLWAFNSLFVVVNNRPSDGRPRQSGLYRLEDTDNNDEFDKLTLLKALKGDGEHGPHSVVLAPDGKSIYLIAGNHTDAPEMDAYRLPKIWQNDNLFPFITDPRGHAANRKEPGGWIAKIEPETNHWEFISGGFRNAFDIAFNESGDLFAYDADMEWDFGMPWYRPTRICHVTSGSEFGWRTGSAKWPTTFEDNLPPVINIGQGSPTNLVSLKNAGFPKEFTNSLLAFDWSFGIVHTIKLKPEGSSFSADREEFLSGVPLPLTDGVIGPDGALYFMTGGRRLESDLYRVSYTGNDVKTNSTIASNGDAQTRRILETYHQGQNPDALQMAWPYLDHSDRFIRYAARIAVEHQPVDTWAKKALSESSPTKAMYALMGLIRNDKSKYKNESFNSLLTIKYTDISESQKLDLLRSFELWFARNGMPNTEQKSKFITKYFPLLPSKNHEINKELSKLLIHVQAPGIAAKVMKLLDESANLKERAGGETATSSEDLILRNPAYGLDIAKMLEKLPPVRQTHYGFLLSNLKTGWTPTLQEKYFKWYNEAITYKGGLSYVGFLNAARKKALHNVPQARQSYFDKLSGGEKFTSNGNDLSDVTFPKGPGRSWKTDQATALFATEMSGRNFEQGLNMYKATLCVRCHTMRGEGSNVGPDLTQLATRFSIKDIIESIIDPNAAISDQYASMQIQLKNGETLVGKIVKENNTHLFISQNPFTPDLTTQILKKDIISQKTSSVSMMLPGLINSLNEEELKDLMAYLMAGGNKEHKVFQ